MVWICPDSRRSWRDGKVGGSNNLCVYVVSWCSFASYVALRFCFAPDLLWIKSAHTSIELVVSVQQTPHTTHHTPDSSSNTSGPHCSQCKCACSEEESSNLWPSNHLGSSSSSAAAGRGSSAAHAPIVAGSQQPPRSILAVKPSLAVHKRHLRPAKAPCQHVSSSLSRHLHPSSSHLPAPHT